MNAFELIPLGQFFKAFSKIIMHDDTKRRFIEGMTNPQNKSLSDSWMHIYHKIQAGRVDEAAEELYSYYKTKKNFPIEFNNEFFGTSIFDLLFIEIKPAAVAPVEHKTNTQESSNNQGNAAAPIGETVIQPNKATPIIQDTNVIPSEEAFIRGMMEVFRIGGERVFFEAAIRNTNAYLNACGFIYVGSYTDALKELYPYLQTDPDFRAKFFAWYTKKGFELW